MKRKKVDPKTVNRHKFSLRSLFKDLTTEAELDNREPYFHRNVMQKIQVKKGSETFNERAKNITEKVFINDQDIDFSSKEISVIRKGNKKDTVSVTPFSLHDLNEYFSIRNARYKGKDDENEFVFIKLYKGEPLPLTNRAIENIVYKYTKSFDKRMSPHKLRHTYATNLAEQTGGDIPLIMSQLGHTSSDTSLLYINTSREKARKAAEMLDKRRNK